VHIYLGTLVLTTPRLGLGNPGGGGLTQTSTLSHPGSLKTVFPTSLPVVEELQVQILKLLLDNKDDNGVSDTKTLVWVLGWEG
jgi:hypothetical protein